MRQGSRLSYCLPLTTKQALLQLDVQLEIYEAPLMGVIYKTRVEVFAFGSRLKTREDQVREHDEFTWFRLLKNTYVKQDPLKMSATSRRRQERLLEVGSALVCKREAR